LEEFARDGWGGWTHMVRCDAEMPKSLGAAPYEVRALAEQVVTAMRLIGPGSVAIGQSWLDPAPPAFHPFGTMGLGRPLGWLRSGPPMIWRGQEQDLRQLFIVVPRAKAMPRVEMALRRFESAYRRVSDHDRLIDHWIALEALFLPDRRDELSYLGPLRISRFLEAVGSARIALFDLMRKSYRLRSEIVHGGMPAGIHEVETATEQVLRRALRKMLLAGEAPDEQAFRALLLG
jgi:hypothetical protein